MFVTAVFEGFLSIHQTEITGDPQRVPWGTPTEKAKDPGDAFTPSQATWIIKCLKPQKFGTLQTQVYLLRQKHLLSINKNLNFAVVDLIVTPVTILKRTHTRNKSMPMGNHPIQVFQQPEPSSISTFKCTLKLGLYLDYGNKSIFVKRHVHTFNLFRLVKVTNCTCISSMGGLA